MFFWSTGVKPKINRNKGWLQTISPSPLFFWCMKNTSAQSFLHSLNHVLTQWRFLVISCVKHCSRKGIQQHSHTTRPCTKEGCTCLCSPRYHSMNQLSLSWGQQGINQRPRVELVKFRSASSDCLPSQSCKLPAQYWIMPNTSPRRELSR